MINKKHKKRILSLILLIASALASAMVASFMIFLIIRLFLYPYTYDYTRIIALIALALCSLTIFLFSIRMIRDSFKSVISGEPMEDERLKNIRTKSAAYSFYASIYWLFGLSLFLGPIVKVELPPLLVALLGLVGLYVIFSLFYLYFRKKGN